MLANRRLLVYNQIKIYISKTGGDKMSVKSKETRAVKLSAYLSPMGAWALSLGTSIGWGSLVVTSSSYLSQAGPMGSVIGIIIGAIIMIVISRSYHYMICNYPDAGGAYMYSKKAFGYDHGFLTAWFLALTYLSIFWANITSLPLFAHYFFGDIFRFGLLYNIFGYNVYLGEALLSAVAIILTAAVCALFKKSIIRIMTGLVLLFSIGITVCFVVAAVRHAGAGFSYEPSFIPDKGALSQIIKIASISPWAFIGYENISHASEEFTFDRKKTFRILVISVISTTALYIFLMLLSVSAYPPEYSSWSAYISDLKNIEGIKGLPAFYAAGVYMGDSGIYLLMAVLFALIVTSFIGNTLALSRLFYSLAKDKVIPEKYTKLNKKGIPWKTFVLVAVLSILIPLLGRTAIGWIVDVTTVGATMIYGFVAASAFKIAKQCKDRTDMYVGLAGIVFMIAVGALLVMPNFFSVGAMEKETYFLFSVWAILGSIYFRHMLSKDKENRFGQSTVVWVTLLVFILFTSIIWLCQATLNSANSTMTELQEFYKSIYNTNISLQEEETFLAKQMADFRIMNMRDVMIVIGIFALSVSMLFSNFSLMRKNIKKSAEQLAHTKKKMNIDPLTGVKSGHAFVEVKEETNERIAKQTMDNFAIAICDMNGLKYVNDNFGHRAGDEYICKAVDLLCSHFTLSPVYRIGGDEFAIILSGHDYEHRNEILAALDRDVEEEMTEHGGIISVGVAEYAENEDTSIEQIIDRADSRMYVRKKHLKALGAQMRKQTY